MFRSCDSTMGWNSRGPMKSIRTHPAVRCLSEKPLSSSITTAIVTLLASMMEYSEDVVETLVVVVVGIVVEDVDEDQEVRNLKTELHAICSTAGHLDFCPKISGLNPIETMKSEATTTASPHTVVKNHGTNMISIRTSKWTMYG